jgi:hypothetical protein
MENELYKMMINNAKEHIKSQNPEKPSEDDFSIFTISSVLAILTGKTKEDVLLDIIKKD